MFHIASSEDILKGRTTDIYFERSVEIIKKKGKDSNVVAEVKSNTLPKDNTFGVLAGVEELSELLKELDVKSYVMPEGTIFYQDEPVLIIEGKYCNFGIYETAILGLLCQASGIATKAARCRLASRRKECIILSFGARRMHPAISPMIERSAYIGGLDGTSVKLAAELIGSQPKGTMPHALVLLFGDSKEACLAFDEIMPEDIPRIAIIDTLFDEKQEAIRIASALQDKLFGVRLDTPASRRGDIRQIIEEVIWELNIRGYKNVKIFLSGGIDEDHIYQLSDIVDGFGVGTALSNAEVINFAMDIVEVEGKALAKRGKKSGKKQVYVCTECGNREIRIFSEEERICSVCSNKTKPLLEPFTENKKLLKILPTPQEIRNYLLEQLKRYGKEKEFREEWQR